YRRTIVVRQPRTERLDNGPVVCSRLCRVVVRAARHAKTSFCHGSGHAGLTLRPQARGPLAVGPPATICGREPAVRAGQGALGLAKAEPTDSLARFLPKRMEEQS